MLGHPQNKVMIPHLQIMGYIKVQFTHRNWHSGCSIIIVEIGQDWVPVLIKLMVTSIRNDVPLWTENL